MNYLPLSQNRSFRSLAVGNSAHRQFHTHIVTRAAQTATRSLHSTVEAVCLKKFKAHDSSLTALLVEEDGLGEFVAPPLYAPWPVVCAWAHGDAGALHANP